MVHHEIGGVVRTGGHRDPPLHEMTSFLAELRLLAVKR